MLNIKPVIVRFKADLLTRHMLVCGATGQGKTIIGYNLIFALLKQGLNFISISFKRDIRHLIRYIPNLLILRISPKSNFKWNIFRGYPGIRILCRIFSETMNLGIGAESMLYEFSMRLYRKNSFTIQNLYDEISKANFKVFRDANWKASLINRLLPFKDMFLKLLSTNTELSLSKLQEKFCIDFELDQAGEYKSFWATTIPDSIYEYRIQNNLRGNRLVTPFLIDEALTVGSKAIQRASFLGEPLFFQHIRLAREFCLGFCFMTSQPSALSDTISSNTAIKILMPHGRHEENLETSRSMNLTKEQIEFISTLKPGQAIMKIENLKPFPVTFPNIEIQKTVTDEEIDAHNEKLLKGTEFEYLIKQEDEPQSDSIIVENQKEELTPEQKAFIWDVYNRPFISKKERMDTINI